MDKLIVEFSQYKGAEPVGGVGGYQSRCVGPDDADRGVRSAGVSSSLSTAPRHSPRESMRCSASKYRSTVSYSIKNEACCTTSPTRSTPVCTTSSITGGPLSTLSLLELNSKRWRTSVTIPVLLRCCAKVSQGPLTVTCLGITGALLAMVFCTNPVESIIEIIREHSSNVKRQRNTEMTLRWATAGMGRQKQVPQSQKLPPTATTRCGDRGRHRRPTRATRPSCHSLMSQ